ncbi:hypothetical protein DEO72_LG8g2390 [Vigna unguiculata]|uniref:Uncharacterized protein n=1 Tax=Vigna unguiculata TaxID=3917 RepID=A0A4D6MUC6_VIGUN|nr:hypothetical protein DEO72_LG8g2390 [Vigna unguiculata]
MVSFILQLVTSQGKNVDVYQEATEIRDYTEAFQKQTEATIIGLFRMHYLKSLIIPMTTLEVLRSW